MRTWIRVRVTAMLPVGVSVPAAASASQPPFRTGLTDGSVNDAACRDTMLRSPAPFRRQLDGR